MRLSATAISSAVFGLSTAIFTIPAEAYGNASCESLFRSSASTEVTHSVQLPAISRPHDECDLGTCLTLSAVKALEYRIKVRTGESIPLNYQFYYGAHLLQQAIGRIKWSRLFEEYESFKNYASVKSVRVDLDGGGIGTFEENRAIFGALPSSVIPNDVPIVWRRFERRLNERLSDFLREMINVGSRFKDADLTAKNNLVRDHARRDILAIAAEELGAIGKYLTDPYVPSETGFVVGGRQFKSPRDFATAVVEEKALLTVKLSYKKHNEFLSDQFQPGLFLVEQDFLELLRWNLKLGMAPLVTLHNFHVAEDHSISLNNEPDYAHSASITGIELGHAPVITIANSWKEDPTLYIRGRKNLNVIYEIHMWVQPEEVYTLRKKFGAVPLPD